MSASHAFLQVVESPRYVFDRYGDEDAFVQGANSQRKVERFAVAIKRQRYCAAAVSLVEDRSAALRD